MDPESGEVLLDARSIEQAVEAVFAHVERTFADHAAADRTLRICVTYRYGVGGAGIAVQLPVVVMSVEDADRDDPAVKTQLGEEIALWASNKTLHAGGLEFDCSRSPGSGGGTAERLLLVTPFDPAWGR